MNLYYLQKDKAGIDISAIKKSCGVEKSAKFIRISVIGMHDLEQTEIAVNHPLIKIFEGRSIEYMMLNTTNIHKFSLYGFSNSYATLSVINKLFKTLLLVYLKLLSIIFSISYLSFSLLDRRYVLSSIVRV